VSVSGSGSGSGSVSVSLVLIPLHCILYDDLTYYPLCCSCFGTEIFLICWVFLAYILHRSSISSGLSTPQPTN